MKSTQFALSSEEIREIAPALEMDPEAFAQTFPGAAAGYLEPGAIKVMESLNRLCHQHGAEAVIHALEELAQRDRLPWDQEGGQA